MAALLLMAAFGQNVTSSHSGWSFSDTLEAATDIVVADVLAGSGVDNGTEVTAKARVRVVRVLRGASVPGAELPLQWRYQPFEPPSASAKVPAMRVLMFLRGNEPLRSAMPGPFGGVFLRVPETPVAYAPDAPVEAKLAAEVAPAAKDLIANHAADFGPHTPEPPVNGVPAEWVRTRMEFESLLMLLDGLPPEAKAGAYRDFVRCGYPDLVLVGLTGRIGAGDLDAVGELERELPRLASCYTAPRVSRYLMGLNLGRNLAAAHALGRMALSEVTLPGLESVFVMNVASTRSRAFLPYLATMLDSPDAFVRAAAMTAFCGLVGPDPARAPYCPSGAPMNDPQQEERDIRFWKQWWAAHGEGPAVPAPPRYYAARQTQQQVEVPLAVRFEGLLVRMSGGGPAYDAVPAQLGEADREMWSRVVGALRPKLDANRQRGMDMMNAARIRGTMPSDEQMRANYAERRAIIEAAIDELRIRLSLPGWRAVERAMQAAGAFMMTLPRPR